MNNNSPIHLPINGTFDLHTFQPKEAGPLVNDYISECLKRGLYSLRIIHGKGKGILRDKVLAVLKQNPNVKSYKPGGAGSGSWGATLVELKKAD